MNNGDSIVYRGSSRRSERNGESYGTRGDGRRRGGRVVVVVGDHGAIVR